MQFIYVGRLEEIKGIKLLFEAWNDMGIGAPKLLVCGNGPLEDWCKSFIKKHNISSIKMMGHVSHDVLDDYIKNSVALIMCSQWYETFGMVIAEAYSCKTAVIVGRIGNIKDLVLENTTGYTFEYNSKEALINAVKKMIISDYITMGINAYRMFKENYTEDSNYKILMSIYNLILK